MPIHLSRRIGTAMDDVKRALLVLVADPDQADRILVAEGLAGAGWQVDFARTAAEAPAHVDPVAALVIIAVDDAAQHDAALLQSLRSRPGAAGSVPVIAWTDGPIASRPAWLARGYDDVVLRPARPEEMIKAVERWRPDGTDLSLDRLEGVFGRAQISAMVQHLRETLVNALSAAEADGLAATAHRIAGVAGTLGFTHVGQAWLAVSEGDSGALDEARRRSRMAVAAIDRRYTAANP